MLCVIGGAKRPPKSGRRFWLKSAKRKPSAGIRPARLPPVLARSTLNFFRPPIRSRSRIAGKIEKCRSHQNFGLRIDSVKFCVCEHESYSIPAIGLSLTASERGLDEPVLLRKPWASILPAENWKQHVSGHYSSLGAMRSYDGLAVKARRNAGRGIHTNPNARQPKEGFVMRRRKTDPPQMPAAEG
jgi:hypothetical protein